MDFARGNVRARAREATRIGRREPFYKARVLALLLVALLLASVIWGRLFYWQVIEHKTLSADAVGQYSAQIVLPAARGQVYDRDRLSLAIDVTVYSVFVSPDQVPARKREHVAVALSSVLGKPVGEVMAILASQAKFAYIARRQPKEIADKLKHLDLPGVGLEADQQRSYLPGGSANVSLAANLLGFVNYEGRGQYGIEGYYNKTLSGQAGYMSTYRDMTGREIALGNTAKRDPVNGQDLVLTLDSSIQHTAEEVLAAGVQANHAESGTVLVMDTHTGGLVAWADYPAYNANDFAHTAVGGFIDPAVSHLYEPGSVMKIVTLSGAIENHAITPQTTIYDPGWIRVQGATLYDWDRANRGTVSYTKVLESSLNVGAVKAMQTEGKDAYYRNLVNFGFARQSGMDVAAESTEPLRALGDFRESELSTTTYGQGIDVNPVQMLAAVNVVANGGRYAQPHVVDLIGGRPAPLAIAPQPQVISPDTAAQMTTMMKSVVQHGSGHETRIDGFQLDEAGKTGTSQMLVNGQYSLDVWSSYVGFMPASNPRFTMLVIVRKPHNATWILNDGYIVAAPLWKRIAQAIVLNWHIAPTPGIAPV